MQVEEYLKDYQPVIYKTFMTSLRNEKLSHAYLISGNPGTPLLESAKFLAKSILCDDPSPLACNSCITCCRIDMDNYPDFIVIDGSKSSIKKDMIQDIESMFDKEALEAKGIKIYILHLVENMTEEATNSLLKFLEEPLPNIYAFLTTNNENGILPTVISRCQGFKLKSLNRNKVIEDAFNLGVNLDDAELLSYFYNEPSLIIDLANDQDKYDDYVKAKEALLTFLEALLQDKRRAVYISQSKVSSLLKNKESLRFYIDMLTQILEDVVSYKHGKQIILTSFSELIDSLCQKLKNIEDDLVEIMKLRNMVNLNLNISLLLDHIVYILVGRE